MDGRIAIAAMTLIRGRQRENNSGTARHGLTGQSTNACLCRRLLIIRVYHMKYSFHTPYLITLYVHESRNKDDNRITLPIQEN